MTQAQWAKARGRFRIGRGGHRTDTHIGYFRTSATGADVTLSDERFAANEDAFARTGTWNCYLTAALPLCFAAPSPLSAPLREVGGILRVWRVVGLDRDVVVNTTAGYGSGAGVAADLPSMARHGRWSHLPPRPVGRPPLPPSSG